MKAAATEAAMNRFKVDHLVDEFLVAECGFDPTPRIGFFVECFDVRRRKPYLIYDGMEAAYAHERPLLASLRLLEHPGFIVCLEDALVAMSEPESEDVPSGVQRTIEVVMQFKAAAD